MALVGEHGSHGKAPGHGLEPFFTSSLFRGTSRPSLVLVSSALNLMNPSFRSTWPQVKQKEQDKVKILDCRTPEEYAFVGHTAMACNIPSKFMKYRWDPKKKSYVMKDNWRFV
jgi:hypothetical protein